MSRKTVAARQRASRRGNAARDHHRPLQCVAVTLGVFGGLLFEVPYCVGRRCCIRDMQIWHTLGRVVAVLTRVMISPCFDTTSEHRGQTTLMARHPRASPRARCGEDEAKQLFLRFLEPNEHRPKGEMRRRRVHVHDVHVTSRCSRTLGENAPRTSEHTEVEIEFLSACPPKGSTQPSPIASHTP